MADTDTIDRAKSRKVQVANFRRPTRPRVARLPAR